MTCVRVEGNQAAIGGLVTTGSDAGAAFLWYAVDRGGPEFDDPVDSSDWPPGFPTVCPSPAGTTNQPAIYQEVEGDIVVQDAPSN